MSGHSKWHSIKHQKAKEDKKRGKLFSRLVKEISASSRIGGGDPGMNPRLRLAIEKANEANMPKDNIDRAIKRGTGELPGISYEEIMYEGYGPGGVAVMAAVTTDNKNRSASDIRRIFKEYGGNLGENGCVSWMFKSRGIITVPKDEVSEDKLTEKVIELEAEDLETGDEEYYQVITKPENFSKIDKGLKKEFEIEDSEITMIPNTYIKLSGREAEKMLDLMNNLEDYEDVNSIYANFDIEEGMKE
ncbi:MAG: YebC/PmpR family DNA-binding transcriptional regulator [Elusimicrobiota bacterium]|nr:YebC/PmpR family DNA-binding transcriptional regulator [Elusimicrobiota bacterium]